MSTEEEREVVRVRVKKCEGYQQPEFRTFAVDPQITSLEVLQHILIRAFDLNGKRNFGISYLSRDRQGSEVYLSLLSDWDLDAAFVSASKPCLQLKIDIKPAEDSPLLEDWDIISPKDVISSDLLQGERRSLAAAAIPFTQSLITQFGRTISRVQQALSWSYGEDVKPFKPPLTDSEFHSYLNHLGQLSRPEDLRLRIYHGGVEPSLRKVVWRYLLNVYPDGLTGQQRMDYMKRKTREYDRLKGEWTQRATPEDLEFIRGNVLKDVLRTDRAHAYYAGSEDSPHLTSLTDLLTTYAITHPQVSYCQGMSDIASPILAVMDNEAHAFICFCGIMKRLEGNFHTDGHLMSVKFQHLKLLLRYSDPEFYTYLLSKGADDLFFCYRWLLLELKREFAFEDALRMLEVTWSSLPPDPPETEVELVGLPLEQRERTTTGAEDNLSERQRYRHMLRPTQEQELGSQDHEQSLIEPRGWSQRLNPDFLEGREEGDGVGSFKEVPVMRPVEQMEQRAKKQLLKLKPDCVQYHNFMQEDQVENEWEKSAKIIDEPTKRQMPREEYDLKEEDKRKSSTSLPAPLNKQASFGEFKYYSARNSESFDIDEELIMATDVRPILNCSVAGHRLPSRQQTEDSEEDFGEQEPLIKSTASEKPQIPTVSPTFVRKAGSSGRQSPSGKLSSPSTPSGRETTQFTTCQTNGRASSPCISNERAASPCFTAGRVVSPCIANEKGSPCLPNWRAVSPLSNKRLSSPSTPTGKLGSSPCLCNGRASSPLLSNRGGASTSSTDGHIGGVSTPQKDDSKLQPNTPPISLPPPHEFGKGNPFMLFLCLSILLEHRDHIMKNNLDYNELAMHFDRLVRKHNLNRILHRAKALFADYLHSEVWDSEEVDEAAANSDSPSSQTPQPPSFSS
ncbi:TBC1 domain family member 25 [Erpetoichthys calabaricus]|uniref:TBC1 domain family, member 25 n=1 Tax=Erpetoichthys calabaricus TaxID=27687 RepID=A0A8C4TEH7_ERPCA|nr:TBC1 domain family member 25 [Erpetoichthys calabaricus]